VATARVSHNRQEVGRSIPSPSVKTDPASSPAVADTQRNATVRYRDEVDSHPTALIDWLDMKKPLPVAISTHVAPVNADVQRNRPAAAEEP
jgi:hypothetical protein